jgi:1-acyl-sn-glycerol-3-phosphate acyltransferase
MKKMFYVILYRLIKQVFLKVRVRGIQNLLARKPFICVANHLGSFGPMSVLSAMPVRLYPWVAHEITERRECGRYLQKDFTEPELNFKPPISTIFSNFLGKLCVSLMKGIEAIPVYKGSKRMKTTVQISLDLLEQGKNILIFPEDPDTRLTESLCEFSAGFISLARHFYNRTRRLISFLPVAVHAKARMIQIGQPIDFDPRLPFFEEKRRLKKELQTAIFAMYDDLENHSEESKKGYRQVS